MAQIAYDLVNIWFPADTNQLYLHNYVHPKVRRNRLQFRQDGLGITARIHPFHLPPGLELGQLINRYIITPGMLLVTEDLEPALGLVDQIRGLAEKGVVTDKIKYEKIPTNGVSFRVFDSSARNPGLFKALMELVEKHPRDARYKRWRAAPGLLRNDDNGKAYVTGRTLEAALERAISIYRMDKRSGQ